MDSFRNFLYWEAASRDTIDFKKIYVDMTGDLLAGLLLSQIVFWHLPNKTGDSKLRIEKKGNYWIAKSHDEWYEEIRFSRKNFDTAIKKLVQLKLVEKQIFRFNGTPTIHIRLIEDDFLYLWTKTLENMKEKDTKKPQKPAPVLDLTESGKSEEPAPVLDLTESGKSICPNGANPFDRIGQIINIENYREDFKEKKEEEDEYIIGASRPDFISIFNLFEKQNGKPRITAIQERFIQKLNEYKIESAMGYSILQEVDDLNYYSIEALDRTFKKGMNRIRGSKGIVHFPRWFATTIKNEDFQMQQDEVIKREMEESNRKYGIVSEKEKNPAELADSAGFRR
jgi:hypothetical protein